MKLGFKTKTTNNAKALSGEIGSRASKLVRDTTFALEADVKSRAPVDSGTLRRSYQGRMESEFQGIVGTDLDYAPHQEFGTRFQPGTPHVIPAFDAARPRFQREMAEIFR